MTLLLRSAELAPLLDMRAAIEITREVFAAEGRGQVAAEPPIWLPLGRTWLRAVVGGVVSDGRVAMRGSVGGARESVAVMLLMDSESGEPLAVMGYPFGTLRTGATVALAIDLLARPDARQVALIGTGRNATSLIEGVACVRQVERVRVFSRSAEHRAGFAADVTKRLGLPCEAAPSAEACVADADVVLTSTNSPTAALAGAWLPPGAHVSSMGRPNELDEDVYLRASQIVVSNKHHELNYYDRALRQPLLALVEDQRIDWDAVRELGDVVVSPDRASREGITVFRESQGGFGDTALGSWAYRRARELGLGQEFDFRGAAAM